MALLFAVSKRRVRIKSDPFLREVRLFCKAAEENSSFMSERLNNAISFVEVDVDTKKKPLITRKAQLSKFINRLKMAKVQRSIARLS